MSIKLRYRLLCFSLFACMGGGLIQAKPIDKLADLPPALLETSGLVWDHGKLWTMADKRNPRLYALSPQTGKVLKTVLLKGVNNRDWETIAVDATYFCGGCWE